MQPWEISTSVYKGSGDAWNDQLQGMFFRPDGLKLYAVVGSRYLFTFDLSSPWNITTLQGNYSPYITLENSGPSGLFILPDGLTILVSNQTNGTIEKYSLPVAWETADMVFVSSTDSYGDDIADITFNDDGSKMYEVNFSSFTSYVYQLSIASGHEYDPDYATYEKKFTLTPRWIGGMAWGSGGSRFYTVDGDNNEIQQFNLASGHEFDVAYLVHESSITFEDYNPESIIFTPNGSDMYISHDLSNVFQYELFIPPLQVFVDSSSSVSATPSLRISGSASVASSSDLLFAPQVTKRTPVAIASSAVVSIISDPKVYTAGKWKLSPLSKSGYVVAVELDAIIDFESTECMISDETSTETGRGVVLHDPVHLDFVNKGYPNESNCVPYHDNDYIDVIFPFSRDVSASLLSNKNRSIFRTQTDREKSLNEPNVLTVNVAYDDTNIHEHFL